MTENKSAAIGARIKRKRKEQMLSQSDLSQKCNITAELLSKIETGETLPSMTVLCRLSRILNCDMNWLATGHSFHAKAISICRSEKELIRGFRRLPDAEKEELLEILQMKLKKLPKAIKEHVKSFPSTDRYHDSYAGTVCCG